MSTLFIDTHSEKVIISVMNDGHVIKKEKFSDRSHSEIAVSLLDETLRSAKLELSDIKEIIVVNGPGSFTGVRIGVTIAKTIAYSLSIPIKTLTSLEMYGVSAAEKFDIVTVSDSKGVYSARCDKGVYRDLIYQKKADFEKYVANYNFDVLENKEIDLDRILIYLADKKYIDPHVVNPIYIKEIDALK